MATNLVKMQIQFRRDIAANWDLYPDVVPAAGEPCFVIDKNILKIGDGTTKFKDLEPINSVKCELTADGGSIVLEDNVFKLVGFDAAAVGAQPRKNSKGELEWVVPSTETVEGLKTTVAGLQSDIKTLQTNVTNITQIVMPPEGGTSTLLDRVESLETKMDGVGEDTVDAKIDAKINAFATSVNGGAIDTFKELVDYVAEHKDVADDMISDVVALKEFVGEKSVEDQIAEAGHMTKAEAEDTLLSKVQAATTLKHVKYEISHKPAGTLVNYSDKEIRVMVPADTEFEHQSSGANANKNAYYVGFKAYAPEGAVSFKEDLAEIISDNTMYYFEGNDFAGIDVYGRRYSICWLAIAQYDEETQTWSTYGAQSSKDKYIGYYYSVEWYDANGVKIDSDCIRINLSNESCHNVAKPYYVAGMIKGVNIGSTVLNAVDGVVNIPVGAGLKSSEEIKIAEDGTMSLGAISWDRINQGESTLVLDGGGATV